MMLAVTSHLSTDIAAVPLLWVLPLAAYLSSFVIAFARRSRVPPTRTVVLCVVFSVSTGVVSSTGSSALSSYVALIVAANVLAVLLAGFAAHARLAATRPVPEHLTLFYLVVSVGGALGGVLNGVVAPLLFEGVWEYWITLALLPLLAVGLPGRADPSLRTIMRIAAAMLGVTAVMGIAQTVGEVSRETMLLVLAMVVVTSIVAWLALRVPVFLSLTLGVATVAVAVAQQQSAVLTERTFYGSYRVQETDGQHRLLHGTTLHGTQFLDAERRGTPTTYYVEDGPVGDVMDVVEPQDTAAVGLGAGAIATYGVAGDTIRFFEIDPAVARTAGDPRWFTYLSDSAADVDVVVGDGRLMLEGEPVGSYDLVILDAFSSDSIPVHVLTREAMEAYVDRLRPGGSVAVHISNRIFDLEPVLAAHAEDLGLRAVVGRGGEGPGATASHWVLLTTSEETVSELEKHPRWAPLPASPAVRWTDDYSSVLSVLH